MRRTYFIIRLSLPLLTATPILFHPLSAQGAESTSLTTTANQEEHRLVGYVYDEERNPLPGVSVRVEGS